MQTYLNRVLKKIAIGSLLAPFIAWEMCFVLLPIILMLCMDIPYITFLEYIDWLNDISFFKILFSSIIHGILCALLTIIICFFFAYAIYRFNIILKRLFIALACLPFVNNFFLHIASWNEVLSIKGPLNEFLLKTGIISKPCYFLYSSFAVTLVTVYINIPFALIPIYISFEKFNYQLVEASNDLGAGVLETIRKVIIPGTASGIINGFFLVFIPMTSEFAINELMGGDKALHIGSLLSYLILSGSLLKEAALVIILFAMTLIISSIILNYIFNFLIKWIGK